MSYFDDSEGDGGSSLTESIIGAISQVGSAAILSQSSPSQLAPYPPPYQSQGYSAQGYGAPKSSGMSWLLVAVLIIGGIFAFKKL